MKRFVTLLLHKNLIEIYSESHHFQIDSNFMKSSKSLKWYNALNTTNERQLICNLHNLRSNLFCIHDFKSNIFQRTFNSKPISFHAINPIKIQLNLLLRTKRNNFLKIGGAEKPCHYCYIIYVIVVLRLNVYLLPY